MRLLGQLTCLTIALAVWPSTSPADEYSLTGMWDGTYYYGVGERRQSVSFSMVLVVHEGEVTGFIREPRTFGPGSEPFLHASFAGLFNEKTRELTFLKSYDGTSGVDHDVEYQGRIAAGGNYVVGGKWKIDTEADGSFDLKRVAGTGYGPYAGKWLGTYHYSVGDSGGSVDFTMFAVHRGKGLTGFIREPKTFGEGSSPWLHASFRGSFGEGNRGITLLKTYDGTSRVDHDVEYRGELSSDGSAVLGGKWEIGSSANGRFTLRREEDGLGPPPKRPSAPAFVPVTLFP